MRMTMKAFFMTLVVVFAVGSASATLVMFEDFETDPTPRGWIADSPVWSATGGNPDGNYSGSRTNFAPWVGMALGGLDVTTTFGNELAASIDVKWAGPSAGICWEVFGNSVGNQWKYDFGMVPPTVWTNYSQAIDTTWTDAEANAAGWFQSGGSGSFSSVWASVDYLLFTQAAAVGPAGTWTASVDNFKLDVIPEPATLSLVAIGGVFGLIRRKGK